MILSDAPAFNGPAGHAVMAMITSQSQPAWPLDCPIRDLSAAGLPAPSLVRFKLFTLDLRLVTKRLGRLGQADTKAVTSALSRLLGSA